MKRNLLLTLASVASLTLAAQAPQAYEPTIKPIEGLTPAANEYNRNARYTNETRSTDITDTIGIAGLKWSWAGYLDSQNQETGVYGQSAGYMIDVTISDSAYTHVKAAEQKYPSVGELDVSGVGINLFSVDPTSSFDIAIIDRSGLVTQETFTVGGTANASSVEWYEFTEPVTVNDTFYVNISPNGLEDQIVVFTNGRTDNLTPNSFNGNLTVLNIDPQGAYHSTSRYVLAGDANGVYDSDWLLYPVTHHSIESNLTTETECLSANELTVDFDFSGNEGTIHNPNKNVEAFYIEVFNSDLSYGDYFATIDFATEQDADTIDTHTTEFTYTFSAAADNDITLTEYYVSMGYSGPTTFTSSTTLTLDECVTTSIEENALDLVWNQTEARLNFNNPVNGNVNVYSVNGRLVKTTNANNSSSVSLAELKTGIYIVEVFNNGERSVLKIMK